MFSLNFKVESCHPSTKISSSRITSGSGSGSSSTSGPSNLQDQGTCTPLKPTVLDVDDYEYKVHSLVTDEDTATATCELKKEIEDQVVQVIINEIFGSEGTSTKATAIFNCVNGKWNWKGQILDVEKVSCLVGTSLDEQS
ncbi:unnamed protein product [Caenorhabditis angaria]|uniref:C6 domain-containing protein n=1 Tax=Caenorhabditis angaria TaxID=860376 RepID=A0A9P1IKQ8_9PELO|nr:unnamed protein product [Caenorhabditis angaria]